MTMTQAQIRKLETILGKLEALQNSKPLPEHRVVAENFEKAKRLLMEALDLAAPIAS